jgi:hypothetical protein
VNEYLRHADEEVLPAMEKSALSIVLGSKNPDAKLCLEVGAAILFDKPIVLVVPPGRVISVALKRVASVIVEADPRSPDANDKIRAAIESVMGNDARVRQ